MTPDPEAPAQPKPAPLPKRDLLLLPMLMAATLVVLFFGADLAAQAYFPANRVDHCELWQGKLGYYKRNCKAPFKVTEGRWIQNIYNDCGYRADISCRSKAANGLRVVVMGSSIARGYGLSFDQSFVGQTEHRLQRLCRRPVDIQTLGVDEALGPTWHTLPDRSAEAAALHPDAVVVTLSPFDIMQYAAPPAPEPPLRQTSAAPDAPWRPPARDPDQRAPQGGLIGWVRSLNVGTTAIFAAQHFLYEDPVSYADVSLGKGDQADFLRAPLTPVWRMRLGIADQTLSAIAAKAKARGLPVVVVFVPSRAQAVVEALNRSGGGLDPLIMDRAVSEIARRNGAAFVDLTETGVDPSVVSSEFFPYDGHPNERAHARLASGLVTALIDKVPAFQACGGGGENKTAGPPILAAAAAPTAKAPPAPPPGRWALTPPSPLFLVFAALAAGIFFILKKTPLREPFLLLVNGLFLASFAPSLASLAPILGFVVFGYGAILALQTGRRGLLPLLIAATLLIFFWLKKYTFIPAELFMTTPYLTLGLSYVFFRVLHLIIDEGQATAPKRIGFLSYLNYTLNFTCLVAGPIQRYPDYQAGWSGVTLQRVGRAVERIILGYVKVAILSEALMGFRRAAFSSFLAAPDAGQRMIEGGAVIALYPLYLFFNFSGYVDVVIGVAELFGLTLPENFDRPFTSLNFIEFWSRWHITLSMWLKTYVYNPLMKSAMQRLPADAAAPYISVFAYFVTFFLVGAWHGQTGEFLFFGVLQGGGVSLNKLYQVLAARVLGRKGYRALCERPIYRAVSRGLTFTWFAFTLLWFALRWPDIVSLFSGLGLGGVAVALFGVLVAFTLLLAALAAGWRAAGSAPALLQAGIRHRYARTVAATALAAGLAFLIFTVNQAPPQIVYKAF